MIQLGRKGLAMRLNGLAKSQLFGATSEAKFCDERILLFIFVGWHNSSTIRTTSLLDAEQRWRMAALCYSHVMVSRDTCYFFPSQVGCSFRRLHSYL